MRLVSAQRSKLVFYYDKVHPDRIENLLHTGQDAIIIGSYQFRPDAELLFEGLLEVLYTLRCLLFHGEIEPTARYRDIYEPAYFILRRFLSCIT